MPSYFDRYERFKENGEVKPVPGITMPVESNDKKVVYKVGRTRLDILSQSYYNNPYHGFLIMAANPQFGGLEFNIPDGEVITIPFPFESAIERYIGELEKHKLLYG